MSLSGFRFLRRALTRRRMFDRTGFVARARRACRQLNKPDFFANLRSSRFGRWRWRFGGFNDRQRFFLDLRFWRFRRRRFNDDNGFAGRGFWRGRRWRGEFGGQLGVVQAELLFKVLGADLIERTGGDLGGGNAQ